MDIDRDNAPSGERWVGFAELAKVRRISRGSAERLARRHGWQKRKGNDGLVRVLAPVSVLADPKDMHAPPAGLPTADTIADMARDFARAIEALDRAVSAANERATRAETQADAARAEVATERARAEGLQADLDRLGADADQLRAQVDELQRAAQRAGWWRRLMPWRSA